jgi:cysteine desulfurase / selenocysteine lyase
MDYKDLVIGADIPVKLNNCKTISSIYLDNASTKPIFKSTLNAVNQYVPMYTTINGGHSNKSLYSEYEFKKTREDILDFLKADKKSNIAIFVQNATEGINKMSYLLSQKYPKSVVLTTLMEHHSNILPWTGKFTVDFIEVDNSGRLIMDDLEAKLIKYQGKVKLVTVSGASNVTGYINPIHKIAALAHKFGAQLLVDGAQLIPHCPVDMKPDSSPEHLDFFVFSAHKLYAPFSIGALIGLREFFESTVPEYVGTNAELVTLQNVTWLSVPAKHEAVIANVIGAVALKDALKTLNQLGMENVKVWEGNLSKMTIEGIRKIPDLKIYLDDEAPRIGIIPINVKGIPHDLLEKALAQEYGIQVRNGYLSAQPYVERLLNVAPDIINNNSDDYRPTHPGIVRISFGLYNTETEVTRFLEVLQEIVNNKKKIIEHILKGNSISRSFTD